MRMITGAILILAAVEAFARAHMVPFPNDVFAHGILYPASMVLGGIGVGILIWGVLTERK